MVRLAIDLNKSSSFNSFIFFNISISYLRALGYAEKANPGPEAATS